jgi:hypothetical protein
MIRHLSLYLAVVVVALAPLPFSSVDIIWISAGTHCLCAPWQV